MGLKHAYQATGTNDGAKQVSVDRWNADHVIDSEIDNPVLSSDPAAPADGFLNLYAKKIGGDVVSLLGGAPYRSLDWEELNHNLFTALAMQKAVLSLVLFLIILVAAFNIVASLTMMVIDKTREVAILKAMGMSSASVSSLFRVAGMAIGLLGVSLGLGIGVLTCKLIERLGYLLDAHVYMIEWLPTQISPSELLITGSVTVLISLLATLYPSLRAARLHPVDGLRYE